MSEWEEVTDPSIARKVLGVDAANALRSGGKTGNKKLSPAAQKFLLELSTQAAEAGETKRMYNEADKYISTLRPGPNRGRFLEIATPEEGGGILDTIGAIAVGGPARILGAITPEETRAFQGLKRLQSENVLGKQILQKGPQTESDAARLQLTELSPSKDAQLNKDIIRQGMQKSDRVRAKAIFYTKWAEKYGINGVSENGNTADQVWARQGDYLTRKWLGGQGGTTQVKVISRRKVK